MISLPRPPITRPLDWLESFHSHFHEFDLLIKRLSSPAQLGRMIKLLPASLTSLLIERALNQLYLIPLKNGDFDFLEQRTVDITLTDLPLRLTFTQQNDQLKVIAINPDDCDADAIIELSLLDGLSLANQQTDPDTLFFRRKLKICGSTELVHQLKNTMDAVDLAEFPKVASQLLVKYQQIQDC